MSVVAMSFLKVSRFISLLAIIAAISNLAACSAVGDIKQLVTDQVFGEEIANPPAELDDIETTYVTKIDWSSDIGETQKYDYTPALEADAIYDANAEGDLVKLDANNGREVWLKNIGEPISGGVGIGSGTVLVGSNKGYVHAYDVTGKFLWKSKVSSEILSVPRYFDGMVIVRTGDNHIFGIDAADGSRKWVYERINPALTLRSSVGVVVDSGAVYAGFAGGKLVAIRADNGKLLWESTIAQAKGVTEIERIADITSLPVVDGPLVYAVAYQGKIAAVDRRNGKVLWNRDISSYSGLSADLGKIFVAHSLGAVYSLDYETSKTFWRQGALSNRRVTVPLPIGGVVVVGDLEGYVHLLSRDEGKFVGRIQLGSDPVMSIIAGTKPSQFIAKTKDGTLYAVSFAEKVEKQTKSKEAEKQAEPEAQTPAKIELTPETPKPVIAEPKIPEPISREPAAPQPESGSSERSILFKNDSILLPDAGSEPMPDSGPGIRLPSGQ
jgi:outer membrane protein assembly factor BamB